MNNLNGCKFQWIYQHYLAWFDGHARPGAAPKTEEEIAGTHFRCEDVFDDGCIILSRMIYYVPLASSESKSGKPEQFGFTELNLMRGGGGEDIEEITPVEYAIL